MDYREYHVAKNGSDRNAGTKDAPFATIQKPADAAAGDRVIVHESVYREWVKPPRGGLSDDCIGKGMPLDEKVVKDIQAMLMENILVGGVYRDVQVYISGARHMPPPPSLMYQQVKNFYADLQWKSKELNQIEMAAWIHAEFVKIHPFQDGNGRTSRLIMNYQLMLEGFPVVSVAKEDRLEYFKALDVYAVEGNLQPFADLVAGLVDRQMEKYIEISEPQQGTDQ